MLAIALDGGYLAFTSSFADEAALIPQWPKDPFQSHRSNARDRSVHPAQEGQGFAAMPALFSKGGVLQHVLSLNHAAATMFAIPAEVRADNTKCPGKHHNCW